MNQLRRVAFLTVAKGCGFAMLAIFCTLVGVSWDPLLAARTGGIVLTLMALVLVLKASRAPTENYRRTELWLMLEDEQRPSENLAQWAIGHARREAFLWFAKWTAALATGAWVLALALGFLR